VGLICTILLYFSLTHDIVTATTYKLTARENGPYGNVLASGFKVNKKYPQSDRIIAVSRDLLKRYPFGTLILIKGTKEFDGVWRVEDVMNKRWKNKIDLLINFKTKSNKFNNIKISRYEDSKNIFSFGITSCISSIHP